MRGETFKFNEDETRRDYTSTIRSSPISTVPFSTVSKNRPKFVHA